MESIRSSDVFGGEIQYFRLEPRYWEPVLLRFKETGLRCVTTYIPWEYHCVGEPDEANPAGVLDLDGRTNPSLNIRGFLELVEKHGLLLNFRCGPFCCAELPYGGHPRWLVMGDADMMVWDCQDRVTPGYWANRKEGSQPCYLHPNYLDLVGHWFEAMSPIIHEHSQANDGCISMINLDNEVSFIVRDSFLGSGYNPVSVSRGGYYHEFLAGKYGSASELPYAEKFACIEDVAPPRAVPEAIGDNLAWYADWMEYKQWFMCEFLRRLRRMHEANGVSGVAYMTNLNPHLPEGVPTRMPAFEEATGGIVGYDFYRGTFLSYSGYHSMARILKLMNASMSYTWSAEFMAGLWNRAPEKRISTDHMRFMSRAALANGCKAINWYMFHDRESWGDSPVSEHGHARPSLQVLAEVRAMAFETLSDWDSLAPVTDVAVVYDLLQHVHTGIGDSSPCNDNMLHVGAPVIDGVEAGRASTEYTGLYRLIEQAGVQAGAVDVMHDASLLRDYPLAFLPGSPVIEGDASAALAEYVAAGGVLIISGPWPGRNGHGRPLRFLDVDKPADDGPVAEVALGEGKVIWHRDYLAQDAPEEERLSSVDWVTRQIDACGVQPAVRLDVDEEVSWTMTQHTNVQPRNLGSAVLHRGDRDTVLYVSNLYAAAARFTATFTDTLITKLENLFTSESIGVVDGRANLDLDRKSCSVFRVLRRG